MKQGRLVLIALLSALAGCAASPESREPVTALQDDLGSLHRPVSTNSKAAQTWFDQGLTFIFAFNHGEAMRSFDEAARLDPKCAMAHWGKALAAGPHINNPFMDAAASKAATESVRKAVEFSAGAKPVERALVEALSKRYADPPPEDRAKLDAAYAAAMREVHQKYPQDADVAVLFAEAMMDLRPWDLWTPDGKQQPGTEEILSVLESVLASHPQHPGANHYYIHSVEASPNPEKAVPAADRLGGLVPGSGHLVHMPSHIYQRVGRYADAVASNQRAVQIDEKHLKYTGVGGFHAVYRAHNWHFLCWAAMFEGRKKLSQEAAQGLLRGMPIEVVESLPDFLDGFLATPYHVSIRFGLWDDLLKEPKPKSTLPLTTAFWHYARALAFSATGKIEEATAEERAFETARAAVPASARMGNNTAAQVLEVARAMIGGELLFRRGEFDPAFERLRDAVRRDDALKYDEPWDWIQPARHSLGALLLQAGRFEEAEAVYREDLKRHPGNGWSLHGLAECLRRRGQTKEAEETEALLKAAWARADVPIRASCFCRTA